MIWFSILLFSNKNYFWCSIVVLLSSLSNILIVSVFDMTGPMSYIQERGFLIKLDGLTAVVLTALYIKDKLAFNMSLLLAFSVVCHTMIICKLLLEPSPLSFFFYFWYDELIMTIGILQMVISSDGITTALRNIREHLLRISFYCWCFNKSISSHKRSEARS